MKYVSIDIKTTGIDPEKDQILEIGAIIEDTTKPVEFKNAPKFHCYIKHERITGSPYALQLNNKILKILAGKENTDVKIASKEDASYDFKMFIAHHLKEPFVAAGKNFAGFGLPFLKKLPNFCVKFHHRVLDPAIYYTNFNKDKVLPSMAECFARATGLRNFKYHEALDDAWNVILLLRNYTNFWNELEEILEMPQIQETRKEFEGETVFKIIKEYIYDTSN